MSHILVVQFTFCLPDYPTISLQFSMSVTYLEPIRYRSVLETHM